MSLIYTKSALKQIKKDDLIDFYLSQQQKMSQLWVEMGHLCNEEDAKEHWGLVDGNELEQAKKEIKQLKEENERLAETADETPDQCTRCDTRFDLQYSLRHCDQDLSKKYDDYFGSEDDDGDLCPDCMHHHK